MKRLLVFTTDDDQAAMSGMLMAHGAVEVCSIQVEDEALANAALAAQSAAETYAVDKPSFPLTEEEKEALELDVEGHCETNDGSDWWALLEEVYGPRRWKAVGAELVVENLIEDAAEAEDEGLVPEADDEP